jgi:hypothetical protein
MARAANYGVIALLVLLATLLKLSISSSGPINIAPVRVDLIETGRAGVVLSETLARRLSVFR